LLHSDPQIMHWLGGQMNSGQMRTAFDRMSRHLDQNGWGVWAITNEEGDIIGAAGLEPIRSGLPVSGIEAAWRLDTRFVGKGYVTNPMRAVMPWAFSRLPVDEILTFTAATNLKSQAVMRRVGFTPDPARDFDHPQLPLEHPLRRHVVYSMKRTDPAALGR
jgi:RimJ/RimL family protein N-acetyltransferase